MWCAIVAIAGALIAVTGSLHGQSHIKSRPSCGPAILVITLNTANKCIADLEVERMTFEHTVVYSPLSGLSIDDGETLEGA